MHINQISLFKFLFTGSHDGGIKLWSGFSNNIPIFNKCHHLSSNSNPHFDSALSVLDDSLNSSSLAYLNSYNGEAKLYEIKSLKSDYDIIKSISLKKVFKGPSDIVSMKMDEQFVLTAGNDCSARLFDKFNGRSLFSIFNRNVPISTVEMNEKLIIMGYADGVINIHCKLTGIILGTFNEHTDRINKIKVVRLKNMPDIILTASNDCTAKLIFDSLKQLEDDIEKPHQLVSDQTLTTQNIQNNGFVRQHVQSISCLTHGGRVNDFAVDKQGLVQLATDNGQVHVYNWLKLPPRNKIKPDFSYRYHSGVKSITIVGQELICGLKDGTIDIRQLDGRKIQCFKAHNDQVVQVGIK